MKFKYIIILFCFIICEKVTNAAYEITIEKIETLLGDDDKIVTFDGLRVKKYNRTSYVLNGKYQLKMDMGDDIIMLVEGFNFQGGQYKKMGEKLIDQGLCKALYVDAFKSEYMKFHDASSVQVPYGTCPFPAMNNTLTNLMFSDNGLTPPYIPGGEKWRIDLKYFIDKEVVGGYHIYGLVRNQNSLLNGG
ncbi:unnamed protein product [Diamesa tonsa]